MSYSGHRLSPADLRDIRAHNYKVDVNLGARAFEKLSRAFPQLDDLPSLKRLQSRMTFLSGVKPKPFDCCINSCVCFVGPFAEEVDCPECHEPRRNSQGRPRNTYHHIPIIPRLQNLYANADTARLMSEYRHTYHANKDDMEDFFDGTAYTELRRQYVTVGEETLPHKYFELPTDIALGLSTDGFCPFKRRKQSCWPLLGINYNMPPSIRFQLGKSIPFGLIPGPHAPKHIDSYLFLTVMEFIELARGVRTWDESQKRSFSLRAYPILGFGDIPAISKLMRMKGVNGLSPCRFCHIVGIRDPSRPRVTAHYTPLHRNDGHSYDPHHLPNRTHQEFIRQAIEVATTKPDSLAEKLAKRYGINGVPILSTLPSLRFPDSFPIEFVHLFENVFPQLIDLWTGDYKGIGPGHEDYELGESVVEAIGQACSDSGITIPSSFGCRVPNIATNRYQFIAESWLLFMTLLGPVLLRQRFKKPAYYRHFIELIRLVNLCLKVSLNGREIQEIEDGFASWVLEFER